MKKRLAAYGLLKKNGLPLGLSITALVIFVTVIFFYISFRNSWALKIWREYQFPATALFLDHNDAKLAMEIGNYYFNGPACVKTTAGRGCYDLSISERAYKKAVAIDPKILWGHYQLARILFIYGKFDEALVEINKELEMNPANLRSLYVRGLIYGYRERPGDLELAEADFRRFTLWAPSEWAGYNDLAWILSKEAKYKDAKDAMLTALNKATDAERNPWLWNAKGLAELNLGEYPAAKESFEKALFLSEELTPEDWRKSYPGNGPESAESGLMAFKKAISENLAKADLFSQ